MWRSFGLTAAAVLTLGAAPAGEWRALDPENTLVVDTTKGRIVVEMRPDLAPKAVERVKLLAREGVYDGLQFHRVIDGFVDQTGNPNNKDGGASKHPDLPPEFQFRVPVGAVSVALTRSDAQEGFVGAVPVVLVSKGESQRATDGKVRGWGAYCPGVVGMGRQADPGTANSEIFVMRAASRRLDHEYTVWGRVVVGLDVAQAMAVGEPPANPDRMLKVRVAADMPRAERPSVDVLDERGSRFRAMVDAAKRHGGASFTICDVLVPTRVR